MNTSWAKAFCTIASVIAGVTLSMFASAQPARITGPVSFVGHGALFSESGKEIAATPSFIREAQNIYLQELLSRSSKAGEYSVALRQLGASRLSEADQIHVNAELIRTLIEEIVPENASQLLSINMALHNSYGRMEALRLRKPPSWATRFAPSTQLQQQLVRHGLKRVIANLATTNSDQAYINECRSAGVPIPPAWGDAAWKSRGRLATKFIVANQEAAVWTFESSSPRGLCIGLPRFAAGASVSGAFGIICQGNDTGKACFWDSEGVNLSGTTPLLKWNGGAGLKANELKGGICTDCHAGENPFIVHPGTPLDRGAILKPNKWIDPIVHPSWPQNSKPGTQLDGIVLNPGEGSCLTCHNAAGSRFPVVSNRLPAYCNVVLKSAFKPGGTMPPGSAGNTAYQKHFDALIAACKLPPPQESPPPHNAPVACSVFDDGGGRKTASSEAIYFNATSQACVPDGTGTGTCRKWFGECTALGTGQSVTFKVFGDGNANASGPSSAVYIRAPQSECVPDGTAAGTCRKWFGLAATPDFAVECYLFDDGLSNWVGPTEAIFFGAPSKVCMPDGTGAGTCRKWFGNCQVTSRPVQQTPPPPSPARLQCLEDCATERNDCMADVGTPGNPTPRQCVERYGQCTLACPIP